MTKVQFAILVFAALFVTLLATGCVKGDKGDEGVGVAGPTGSAGSTGQAGNAGTTGPIGQQGVPGTPGTQISIVPLCPGVDHYPAVFVEVGMCINNNLYAVYSANVGFMTLLTPGAYSSNAIGSACNLTVAANCIVIH